MHIPDGFIGPGVSAAAGAAAIGTFGVALRKARHYLTDRLVPMAALVAAFVFAAQMINFPVIPGMSGHLLGGVLAAVLVGPWAAFIVMTIVLLVQGFLFADGGLSALGLNIVNMGLIGALGGTVESFSPASVLWAMLGTHLLIGIGEGIITFLVVGAVIRSRPDLVYGAPTYTGRRTEELVT